jgi:hypothetical protein
VNPIAKLVYGVRLGGEGQWEFDEVDEDGEPTVDWLDADDFEEQVTTQVVTAPGLGHATDDESNDHQPTWAAHEGVGLTVVTCSDADEVTYTLATYELSLFAGDLLTLNLTDLEQLPALHDWDRVLGEALQVLGLTPHQPQPNWILCADHF